jgi:hypothetical protein
MGIDFEHGERRYLYTEEDPAFAQMPVLTRAFAAELLKFCDRLGVIPTAGEAAADVVCRRVGAHMGERRQIRQILPALVRDGYLVEHPGALVIRNFLVVHYRRDPERLRGMEAARAELLAKLAAEHAACASRARVKREPSASGARVVRESCTKLDPTPRNQTTHVEPSVPFPTEKQPAPVVGCTETPARPPAATPAGGQDGRPAGGSAEGVRLSALNLRYEMAKVAGNALDCTLLGANERAFQGILNSALEQGWTAADFLGLAEMAAAGELARQYRGAPALAAMLGRPEGDGERAASGLMAALRMQRDWRRERDEAARRPRLAPAPAKPQAPAQAPAAVAQQAGAALRLLREKAVRDAG